MVFNFIGFNFFNDVYCYICIIKDLTLILLVLFILLKHYIIYHIFLSYIVHHLLPLFIIPYIFPL